VESNGKLHTKTLKPKPIALQEKEEPGIPFAYEDQLKEAKDRMGADKSFDLILKEFRFAGKNAFILGIDGFIKDEPLLWVVQDLMFLPEKYGEDKDLADWLHTDKIAYAETELLDSMDDVIDRVLKGAAALFIDGQAKAIIIDLRTYPARGIQEPDLERVMRGPRDGFVETIIFNTAMIRRRLRDPALRTQLVSVGTRSRTDVAVLYVEDIANPSLVDTVVQRLKDIEIDGLPMAEKAIEEFILPENQWWNPFPKVRYTERPDVAAVHLLEGHIVIIVDTSPSAIILPTTFFHHFQHAEEYHEEVAVGVYLRWIRMLGALLAWFGPPLWVALTLNQDILPAWLQWIGPKEVGIVPIFLQFLLAEIGIDLIRMALIHTPNSLATSLGLIGAVLIGQLAVEVGLFSNEVILYVSLAALGGFAIPSLEMSNAIRLMRLVLLMLVGMFSLIGFGMGVIFSLIVLLKTSSFGYPYLWPLWPFDGRALISVLIRKPEPLRKLRPALVEPVDPDESPKD